MPLAPRIMGASGSHHVIHVASVIHGIPLAGLAAWEPRWCVVGRIWGDTLACWGLYD